MNARRKHIIIAEIEYWKQSKLLPEHFCDFLITLYAQGEVGTSKLKNPQSIFTLEKKKIKRTLTIFALLTVISSSVMFVPISYSKITLVLAIVFFCVLLFLAVRGTLVKTVLSPFLYILSAFMLLMISMKLWLVFYPDNSIILVLFLALNCLAWLFLGRLVKLYYFIISGIAGLLIIAGFLIGLF